MMATRLHLVENDWMCSDCQPCILKSKVEATRKDEFEVRSVFHLSADLIGC